MKTLLKMMAFISIFVSITSCSNENTLENMLPAENKVHSDSFRFRYQGVEYTAEYELQDSTIVFINPEIGNMLSKLNNNPNTSTLTYSNGTIEYFDSTKELELFVEEKFQRSDNAQTRLSMAYLTSITLKVYEHKDFGGEVLTYNGPIEVPNMKNAYNKKLSNFKSTISSIQEGSPQALYREREKLVRAFDNMKNELQTYENNLGFLTTSSKKGNSLLTEINRKVEKLKADIELVKEKIKVVDENIKNQG